MDPDPLGNIPNPDDPVQVFAFVRGGIGWVEFASRETRQGFVVTLNEALRIAARINVQAADLMDRVGEAAGQMVDVDRDDPRLQRPMWERDPN